MLAFLSPRITYGNKAHPSGGSVRHGEPRSIWDFPDSPEKRKEEEDKENATVQQPLRAPRALFSSGTPPATATPVSATAPQLPLSLAHKRKRCEIPQPNARAPSPNKRTHFRSSTTSHPSQNNKPKNIISEGGSTTAKKDLDVVPHPSSDQVDNPIPLTLSEVREMDEWPIHSSKKEKDMVHVTWSTLLLTSAAYGYIRHIEKLRKIWQCNCETGCTDIWVGFHKSWVPKEDLCEEIVETGEEGGT